MRNSFQNYRQLLNDLQIILNDSPTINKKKRSNQANQNKYGEIPPCKAARLPLSVRGLRVVCGIYRAPISRPAWEFYSVNSCIFSAGGAE